MSTELQQHQSEELQNYSITNARQMLHLAADLTKFIRDNKLVSNIKGKEFVNVEAWTFAGMSMGLTPIVQTVENLSTDSEIKYRATVDIVNLHTGALVSRGYAICSNRESTKKGFDEYAIASMAQTRATGKGYRLPLGWLIKAAGFEPCPSEEMDTVKEQEEERNRAIVEYISCSSHAEIDAVWKKYPQHRKDQLFLTAAKAMAALHPKEAEPLASEKQVELLTSLANSHHIPSDYRAELGNMDIWVATSSEASAIIEKLQKFIADGIEYEKNNPATEEQVEILEMLLENAAFSDEEEAKGKEAVAAGMSIHKANLFITKLEKKLQDSTKKLQQQAERRGV